MNNALLGYLRRGLRGVFVGIICIMMGVVMVAPVYARPAPEDEAVLATEPGSGAGSATTSDTRVGERPTRPADCGGDAKCLKCAGSPNVFLGFRAWFYGLTKYEGGECRVLAPSDVEADIDNGVMRIEVFVWIAILNLLADAVMLAGLVATGFIIYGGFKYIMSRGEPGRIMQGKATLVSAVIGLFICMLATIIVNSIMTLLVNATGA